MRAVRVSAIEPNRILPDQPSSARIVVPAPGSNILRGPETRRASHGRVDGTGGRVRGTLPEGQERALLVALEHKHLAVMLTENAGNLVR